jgi:hypothetical protein
MPSSEWEEEDVDRKRTPAKARTISVPVLDEGSLQVEEVLEVVLGEVDSDRASQGGIREGSKSGDDGPFVFVPDHGYYFDISPLRQVSVFILH